MNDCIDVIVILQWEMYLEAGHMVMLVFVPSGLILLNAVCGSKVNS